MNDKIGEIVYGDGHTEEIIRIRFIDGYKFVKFSTKNEDFTYRLRIEECRGTFNTHLIPRNHFYRNVYRKSIGYYGYEEEYIEVFNIVDIRINEEVTK